MWWEMQSESTTKREAGATPRDITLPKTGYFSIADTEQEVYSKATERFDPAKKGGRYKNEFIWNTNWQEALERDAQLDRKRAEYVAAEQAGTLPKDGARMNFGLLSDLNDMSVDMSAQLNRKRAPRAPAQQQSAKAAPKRRAVSASFSAQEPMSRLNAEKLNRFNRNRAPPMTTVASRRSEDEEERARLVAEENAKYEAQKRDFLLYTLALTAVGTATTYVAYSQDVSASYIVGALGGYAYLRLLGKSVDAVASQSAEGASGGISSQARLLIPLILILVYNRFNLLYAEQAGITLQLLPMLVGFFTYKAAVIARESQQLMASLSAKPGGGAGGGSAGP
ncbi:hypothetical protein FOA52_013387 [Chlamydomonas sp. UWO 241]|nr:hypothetical protein FOA52_013387 [Chlamydomonas sp. UWO 241]